MIPFAKSFVSRFDLLAEASAAKTFDGPSPTVRAQALPQSWIGCQLSHRFGEFVRVAWFEAYCVCLVGKKFCRPASSCRDHWFAAGHRLDDRSAKGFRFRARMDHDIQRSEAIDDVLPKADETNVLDNVKPRC